MHYCIVLRLLTAENRISELEKDKANLEISTVTLHAELRKAHKVRKQKGMHKCEHTWAGVCVCKRGKDRHINVQVNAFLVLVLVHANSKRKGLTHNSHLCLCKQECNCFVYCSFMIAIIVKLFDVVTTASARRCPTL